MKNKSFWLAAVLLILLLAGCAGKAEKQPDYTKPENWAYHAEKAEHEADLFLIAPTVYFGEEGTYNMPLEDEEGKASFLGALNMERGIYEDSLNLYAPYYRQATFWAYDGGGEAKEKALDFAFADVCAAFETYLKEDNGGRPFVLAGFSQGADMCVRLMKAYPEKLDKMIACYALGWTVTDAELAAYPQLVPASGETDTGVIICFNSEAESISSSFTVPAGTKSICINPLNWRTDGTPASAEENLGACFTDYSGAILSEVPALTGAYVDPTRGTLKVPDVSPEDYPGVLSLFADGEYHLYEYQFFFRNLQENVAKRVAAYFGAAA